MEGGVVVAKLNAKRQAFVDAWEGNATAAALAAGYSPKTAYSQGQRLLKIAEVQEAIKAREAQRLAPTIASRRERVEMDMTLSPAAILEKIRGRRE